MGKDTFKINDWMILNDIIFDIYTIQDFEKMKENVLLKLKLLVEYQEGDFFYHPENRNPSLFYLDVVLYEETYLGTLRFYRDKEFTADEIMMVNSLKKHLTYRFQQEQNTIQTYSIEEISNLYDLTSQEHKILDLIMHRYSNEEIVEQLCISKNTLKKHTIHIYHKVGVNSRLELFKKIKGTK